MLRRELSPARKAWKIWYRQMRIVRRESAKASLDMIAFGSGFVEMGEHLPDFVRHVPFDEVRILA